MALSFIKSLLPKGPAPRTLPSGIGRGIRLNVDFSRQSKMFVGLYEAELNPHIRRLCPPGTPSFDVGANVGYDALVLAKLSGAPVVSFEMDPELASEMRENLALNPSLASLIDLRVAMVTASSAPDGSAVTLDDVAYAGDGGVVPGFVKIDVEGAEADVLSGAARLLGERRPGLVIETHDAAVDERCRAILTEHGYAVQVVEQRSWLRDHRPIAHNRWLVASA